jgi:hypothetical protein
MIEGLQCFALIQEPTMSKRELIEPHKGDKRYARRDEVTFLYGTMLYVVLCDVLLRGGANYLTRTRGEKWVKELDYIYLALGVIGIVGLINRIDALDGRFSKFDLLAPMVLMTAVVVRFIKTRAEIGGWNK